MVTLPAYAHKHPVTSLARYFFLFLRPSTTSCSFAFARHSTCRRHTARPMALGECRSVTLRLPPAREAVVSILLPRHTHITSPHHARYIPMYATHLQISHHQAPTVVLTYVVRGELSEWVANPPSNQQASAPGLSAATTCHE